jgi:hypothetical protein
MDTPDITLWQHTVDQVRLQEALEKLTAMVLQQVYGEEGSREFLWRSVK